MKAVLSDVGKTKNRTGFGKSHRPEVWLSVPPAEPLGGTMSTQPYVFSCDDCGRYSADPFAFGIFGDLSGIKAGDYDLPVDVLDIPEVPINAPSGRIGAAATPMCRQCGSTSISLRYRRADEYPAPRGPKSPKPHPRKGLVLPGQHGRTGLHQPEAIRKRISANLRKSQRQNPPKRGKGGRFV